MLPSLFLSRLSKLWLAALTPLVAPAAAGARRPPCELTAAANSSLPSLPLWSVSYWLKPCCSHGSACASVGSRLPSLFLSMLSKYCPLLALAPAAPRASRRATRCSFRAAANSSLPSLPLWSVSYWLKFCCSHGRAAASVASMLPSLFLSSRVNTWSARSCKSASEEVSAAMTGTVTSAPAARAAPIACLSAMTFLGGVETPSPQETCDRKAQGPATSMPGSALIDLYLRGRGDGLPLAHFPGDECSLAPAS